MKLLLAALAAAAPIASLAIGQRAIVPVAKVSLSRMIVPPGATFTGTVSVTFAPGLHAYQNPPSQEFEIPVKLSVKGGGFKLVRILYPKGKPAVLAGDTKPSKVYSGTIAIPVVLKAPTKPGTATLSVLVAYQQCNANSCFPPATVSATTQVSVSKRK